MEKSLAEMLVEQQADHDLSKCPRFRTTDEGIGKVTQSLLYLRKEVFRNERERSLERMTQNAVELAALAIKFLIDLT